MVTPVDAERLIAFAKDRRRGVSLPQTNVPALIEEYTAKIREQQAALNGHIDKTVQWAQQPSPDSSASHELVARLERTQQLRMLLDSQLAQSGQLLLEARDKREGLQQQVEQLHEQTWAGGGSVNHLLSPLATLSMTFKGTN